MYSSRIRSSEGLIKIIREKIPLIELACVRVLVCIMQRITSYVVYVYTYIVDLAIKVKKISPTICVLNYSWFILFVKYTRSVNYDVLTV